MTWVTFLYSAGLPALYPIIAFSLILIFWFDKMQVIYFYQKPRRYDESSLLYTVQQWKYVFVWHFLNGAIVYSNRDILRQDSKTIFNKDHSHSLSLKRYADGHSLVFVIFMAFYIFLAFYGN